MLLLGEHRHHDQGVQVDSLAEHPEVVAAHGVHLDEGEQLAAGLEREQEVRRRDSAWRLPTAPLTHGVLLLNQEPRHGHHGVQHEGEEEVLVERYPLAAQTSVGKRLNDHFIVTGTTGLPLI